MKNSNLIAMKSSISKFSLFLFFMLTFTTVNAQQWSGSSSTTGSINRSGRVGVGVDVPLQMLHTSGNLRLDGKFIYFGDTQFFQGNGASAFLLKSNHESVSQLMFRNQENTEMGRVTGTGGGNFFGLRDSANKWTYLAYKGVYSQMRVSNIPILTARLYDLGLDSSGADSIATRVGININNTAKDLHVRGDARVDHLYINTNSNGGYNTDEYFMFVDGKAAFEEVRVQLSQNWGDYVFADDYKPMPLEELKDYVNTNKHLPNMPKASQLETEGLEISDIVTKQMVNIEELVLHTIEQEEKIKDLESKLLAQQKEIDAIRAALLDRK